MTAGHNPEIRALVAQLHAVADLLDRSGERVAGYSRVLAARGWPGSTGVSDARGSTVTSGSSTERAALDPHPWAGIDEQYVRQLRLLGQAVAALRSTMQSVLAQAPSDDRTPAGTGSCRRCDRFCRPTAERPQERIRSGYCPACYRRWLRLGKPERSSFERGRGVTTVSPSPR
jgi:hypothetical protein